MPRRLNRYTGEDEVCNRLERLLERERRRVRYLCAVLVVILGWLFLQMLSPVTVTRRMTRRGFCLNFD